MSLCSLDPLDDEQDTIRNGWPLPPEVLEEVSDFQDQTREYIGRLDDIRNRVISANSHSSKWLEDLAEFRGIFVGALNNLDAMREWQVATEYLNAIHRQLGRL